MKTIDELRKITTQYVRHLEEAERLRVSLRLVKPHLPNLLEAKAQTLLLQQEIEDGLSRVQCDTPSSSDIVPSLNQRAHDVGVLVKTVWVGLTIAAGVNRRFWNSHDLNGALQIIRPLRELWRVVHELHCETVSGQVRRKRT